MDDPQHPDRRQIIGALANAFVSKQFAPLAGSRIEVSERLSGHFTAPGQKLANPELSSRRPGVWRRSGVVDCSTIKYSYSWPGSLNA